MAEKIKVVLVDDHHIVRRGLRSFLNAFDDLTVVGEAASGEEALQHIEEWLPDVVVMDMLMPGGIDGIETIRQVRTLVPNTRIVALTSYTDDSRVVALCEQEPLAMCARRPTRISCWPRCERRPAVNRCSIRRSLTPLCRN